jgi:2-polyprenyl-6-hydroxyphenyl methylase/3-demethylubiquinone-9 3-methyltransferase
MYEYYKESLSGEKLKGVYDVATARVRQYLETEVHHVVERITPGADVVELGCGYGRILPVLAEKAGTVVGIDTSIGNLTFGKPAIGHLARCHLLCMDAARLAFRDSRFDCVVCIQNGISAFHVDRHHLIREAVRVARPGGVVLFSTYADGFWEDRLAWFELQAEAGLLGEIDYERTGSGVIVCKDGFTATTVSPADFRVLTAGLDAGVDLVEVDGSSLFCEIRVS